MFSVECLFNENKCSRVNPVITVQTQLSLNLHVGVFQISKILLYLYCFIRRGWRGVELEPVALSGATGIQYYIFILISIFYEYVKPI